MVSSVMTPAAQAGQVLSFAGANRKPRFGQGVPGLEIGPRADVFAPRFGGGKTANADLIAELRAQIEQLKKANDLSGLAARLVPATVSIVNSAPVDRREIQEVIDDLESKSRRRGPFGGGGHAEAQVNQLRKLLKEGFKMGSGSGFWIVCSDGKPRILTNAHVAKLEVPAMMQAQLPFSIGKPERTGFLNRLKTALNFEQKQPPQSVKLKLATAADGTPAYTEEYDLALLEPVDDRFYVRKGGQYLLPNGAEPLELIDDIHTVQPGERVAKAGNSGGVGNGNFAVGYLDGFETKQECECGDPKHELEAKYMAAVTDLTIHPGDSGSALVNMDGKVIGINSRTMTSHGEGLAGYASAVAANEIRKILQGWGFLK